MSKIKVFIYGIAIAAILICCSCTINKHTENKAMHSYNDYVEIIEDEDGMAVVSGQDRTGSYFQIQLNYAKTDVILNNAFLTDLSDDKKQVLCLEMNIFNSVSPDLNTILIYDMENSKILFPTPDKAFIYDGYIDQLETDSNLKNVIRYSSYTKISGTSIEDENSIVVWDGSSFDTLEYQNKLLLETDEYMVFYRKSLNNEGALFKLLIIDPHTLQDIQDIELGIDEASITSNIKNEELIALANNESFDLYVKGYGTLHWDRVLKKFK